MNLNSYTSEQAAAIDHRGSACVLSSGAGCGKTTVLTARYLSLLERDHLEPTQIAAMTFTEKAAREMRKRIRDALAGDDKWKTARRQLEAAPIQTIHAFGQSLILQNAELLGLSDDAKLLDESAGAVLRNRTIRESLEALIVGDTALSIDVQELVVIFSWSTTIQLFERFLRDPDRPEWEAFASQSAESIADSWINGPRRTLLGPWIEYLASAEPSVAALFDAIRRVKPPQRIVPKLERIRTDFFDLAKATDLATAVENLAEYAKAATLGDKKQWNDESEREWLIDLLEPFRKTIRDSFAAFYEPSVTDVLKSAEVSSRFVRVALHLQEEYQRAKTASAAFDYTDQIALARDLLRDHAEVRDSLVQQYHAVMVDEFQDTDPVQMEMVRWLCGGAEAPENLFVVGDEKQSIYRFRGAEVSIFQSLRQSVPESSRLSLTQNYRSRPGIISFVNALFSRRMIGYEPLRATLTSSNRVADVEFLWTQPLPDDERLTVDITRGREAATIARRIQDMVEHGHQLKEIVLLFRATTNLMIYEQALRDHGIDYYVVGGRAFFAQQEIYDLYNLLQSIDDPDDDVALVGLLRSPFVGLSDDALTLLAKPGEPLVDQLTQSTRLDQLPADDQAALARFQPRFAVWREIKDESPVCDLIHRAIAVTGYDASLQFESLADRKLANLWKLIDTAREYDEVNIGVAGFIAQLREAIERQPREGQAATRPEEDNVVRIMSIHQAKGLEFPIVFVPDLSASRFSSAGPAVRWHRELGCLVRRPADIEESDPESFSQMPYELGRVVDEMADWQEELRVLYVACTRAAERLILSASWMKELVVGSPTAIPSRGANVNTFTLAERFDLGTGQCLVPGSDAKVLVRIVEPDLDPPELKKRSEFAPPWQPKLPGRWANAAPAMIRLPESKPFAFDIDSDGQRIEQLEWRYAATDRLGYSTMIVGVVPLIICGEMSWRLCFSENDLPAMGAVAAAALRPAAEGRMLIVESYTDAGEKVASMIPRIDVSAEVELIISTSQQARLQLSGSETQSRDREVGEG